MPKVSPAASVCRVFDRCLRRCWPAKIRLWPRNSGQPARVGNDISLAASLSCETDFNSGQNSPTHEHRAKVRDGVGGGKCSVARKMDCIARRHTQAPAAAFRPARTVNLFIFALQQARWQRRLSQGLLDLKRLYWNCREFRTGKRKKQTPYERLGQTLPTGDWWELLNSHRNNCDNNCPHQKLRLEKVPAFPRPSPCTFLWPAVKCRQAKGAPDPMIFPFNEVEIFRTPESAY